MDKHFSLLLGIALILLGIAALPFTLVLPLFGIEIWSLWRLWPLLVLGVGTLFVLPPLLVREKPFLGLLFIPGAPTLSTGFILLLASLFDLWEVWAWLWPVEMLALALGFLLAAIYVRSVWLAAPAIIVGLNGIVFQFCALTGLWNAWAVLWTVEPLAVGLALLVVGLGVRSPLLSVLGFLFCALAGVGLFGMSLIFSGWWLTNLLGPALLIFLGILFLIWGAVQRRTSPQPV